MKIKFQYFPIMLVLFQYILFAQEVKWYHISADVANIRKTPSNDASIIGRLRIGNSFGTYKVKDDWAFIDSIYTILHSSSPSEKLNGWINLSACSEQKIDINFIQTNLMGAKTIADSIRWYERLSALLPEDKQILKKLQDKYQIAGDTLKAQGCRQKISGTEPIYIAQRQKTKILLRGVIDSLGEFRSLEWQEIYNSTRDQETFNYAGRDEKGKWELHQYDGEPSWETTKKEAQKLRVTLSGMVWYKANPIYVDDHTLYQFPIMTIVPPYSLNPNAKEFCSCPDREYYADISGIATFGISLGFAESWFGDIFATKPVYIIPVSGLINQSDYDSLYFYTRKIAGQPLDSFKVNTLSYNALKEYGYKDISIRCAKPSGAYFQQRSIFDKNKVKIWPPENHAFSDAAYYYTNPLILNTEWFRFGNGPQYPAYTITPFSTPFSLTDFQQRNGNHGLHIVRISKTGAKTFIIRSEYWGD